MKLEYGPREKIEKEGISSLTDEELLAILIKTGNRNENVIDLSKRILDELSTLSSLNDYTYEELMNFNGIGKAKAMTIVCALELSRRIEKHNKNIKTIKTPYDAYEFVYNDYINLSYEKVTIIYLNSNFKIVSKYSNNNGSFDRVNIDIKELLKRALKLNISYIIMIHNHPSGSSIPSKSDIYTMNEIESKLNEFGIVLFDSIIINDSGYYSMKYSLKF